MNQNGYETPNNGMRNIDHIYSSLTVAGRNSHSTVRSESSSSEYTYVDAGNPTGKQLTEQSSALKRTILILLVFLLGLAFGAALTSLSFLLKSKSKNIFDGDDEAHTGNISFSTPEKYQFRMIRCELGKLAFERQLVSFAVQACSDVFIVLSPQNDDLGPLVEVALGINGNTRSGIRRTKLGGNRVTTKGEFLNCRLYNNFWISWKSSKISVGLGLNESENTMMEFVDGRRLSIRNIGISTGFGNVGQWLFIERKL